MIDIHKTPQPHSVNTGIEQRMELHEVIVLENEKSIHTLQKSEKHYRRLFESAKDGILILDADTGRVDDVNPFLLQLLGYPFNEIWGKHIWELGVFKNIAASKDTFRTLQDNEYIRYEDLPLETHDGRTVSVEFVSNVYLVDQTKMIQCIIRDITKHLKLKAQFQHSQKMESVGLLAGGVAHDYNNMLSIILGYTELAMKKVKPGQPLHSDLNMIYEAAMHSADITRQLMAFARKQIITPVVVDLNTNIARILNMLRRLIGENIDLAWRPYKDLCLVKIDPGQIDQIIANLCVNAMDAIADTGTITIETGHVVINDYDCAIHPEFVKGEYALLSVTDDGCGMNKETLGQIFEPFFTSKGVGKGTGLGLSTVYGIIKQNNGFIYVESEPGKGTNFKIYLKRYVGPVVSMKAEKAVENPLSQGETVLLVEDEPMLMKMQKVILEKLGYRVLAAGLPSDALEIAGKHTREISLVITDIVMPEMNGLALVEQLKSLYPGMKNLFMSDYSADAITHVNESGKGVNFIQKPFSINDLALKVREVLEKVE